LAIFTLQSLSTDVGTTLVIEDVPMYPTSWQEAEDTFYCASLEEEQVDYREDEDDILDNILEQ